LNLSDLGSEYKREQSEHQMSATQIQVMTDSADRAELILLKAEAKKRAEIDRSRASFESRKQQFEMSRSKANLLSADRKEDDSPHRGVQVSIERRDFIPLSDDARSLPSVTMSSDNEFGSKEVTVQDAETGKQTAKLFESKFKKDSTKLSKPASKQQTRVTDAVTGPKKVT
jgi:hypothetical protein